MQELLAKLEALEAVSSVFEPGEGEQKQLIHEVSEFTVQFIRALPDARSFVNGQPDENSLAIGDKPKNLQELIGIYNNEVVELGIKAASGGHMGYIPGGGLYASSVADYLAAVTNEYAGVSYASPGAVAIENVLIEWLKRIFHFPESATGNLSSGGSIANLVAIVAARDKYGVKNEQIRKHVIYMGNQTHHCIRKGIRIAGLEDINIRNLEVDNEGRISVAALKCQIKKDRSDGLTPFMIIASAGTTDTGVVDPLKELGNLSRDENTWFHIDGAYGGFFILSESKKHLFEGIEMADSLVVDPHKGLFLPYGLGVVLIRNKEDAIRSFSLSANYMQDAMDEEFPVSPADVSPELTKHFRGLRLWLPLQMYGIRPFIACLDEKLLLTELVRNRLSEIGFVVGPQPDLSVTYFYYPSKEIDENTFNQKLMEFIHQDGSVFLSSTLIGDQFVIRVAILSFRTKRSTIERCVEMVERCLQQTKESFIDIV